MPPHSALVYWKLSERNLNVSLGSRCTAIMDEARTCVYPMEVDTIFVEYHQFIGIHPHLVPKLTFVQERSGPPSER